MRRVFPAVSLKPVSKVRRYLRQVVAQVGLFLVVFLPRRWLGTHNVVSLDPARRADGEPCFRPRSQIPGGLVVAAKIGGLGGGEVGLRVIALAAIGHGELGVADR